MIVAHWGTSRREGGQHLKFAAVARDTKIPTQAKNRA
jgi:hypothetical protein